MKGGQDHMEDHTHQCHKDLKVTLLIGKDLEIRIDPKDIIDQMMKWESMNKIENKWMKAKVLLHQDGKKKSLGEKANIRRTKNFVLHFSSLQLSLQSLDFV